MIVIIKELKESGYPLETLVYEIGLFLILLLSIGHGLQRGLLSSLVYLLRDLGSALLGGWLADQFGAALYRNTIGLAIGNRLAEEVHEYGGAISDVLDGMPYLPESLHETLTHILDGAGEDMVPRLVEAMEPLLLPFLQGAIFLVVYVLLRLALKPVASMLLKVNHLPLVGPLNTVLGAIVGIGIGLVDDFLLTTAAWLLAGLTGNALPVLSQAIMRRSILVQCFAAFNPFIRL